MGTAPAGSMCPASPSKRSKPKTTRRACRSTRWFGPQSWPWKSRSSFRKTWHSPEERSLSRATAYARALGIASSPAQATRPASTPARPDRHRVGPRKAFRVEADPCHTLPVLLHVLADPGRGHHGFGYLGRALDPHHFASVGVRVEVEIYSGGPTDILQLLPPRLGVDQERLAVPPHPYGHGLRPSQRTVVS